MMIMSEQLKLISVRDKKWVTKPDNDKTQKNFFKKEIKKYK